MNNTETINHMGRTYVRKAEHRSLDLYYTKPKCGRNPGNNDGWWIAINDENTVVFEAATRANLTARINTEMDMTDEQRAIIAESRQNILRNLGLA